MSIFNEKDPYIEDVRTSILNNIKCLNSAILTNGFDSDADVNFLIRVDNTIEKWIDELKKINDKII
jgi:hypothetical protein